MPRRLVPYRAPLAVSINPSISSLRTCRIRPETESSNRGLRVSFNIWFPKREYRARGG
jgi:hypothetical protein